MSVVRVSRESRKTKRPKKRMPRLFARGGRDRVLVCLAVNGPLHVREIGRLIGSDARKTFDMVALLEQAGLVVKRDQPGFRKVVALDKALGQLYFQVGDLLRAMDKTWPVERSDRSAPFFAKTPLRGRLPLDDQMMERWFCSVPRSRALLFVAAVGRTNMSDIVRRAEVGSVSAMYAVNYWEREGVFRSRMVGCHRIVELDEEFSLANELWTVLDALVRRSEKYRGFRAQAVELGPYTRRGNL